MLQSNGVITPEEKQSFLRGFEAAYHHLDMIVHSVNHETAVDFHKCRSMLELFKGHDDEYGFIFTLNQDLLFERHWAGSPDLVLPGIRNNNQKVYINGRIRAPYPLQFPEGCLQLPAEDELQQNSVKNDLTPFSYIKLHGSYNFISALDKSKKVMVIGYRKPEQISSEPLLKSYFELFREVLSQDGIKLMIIGYGFKDKHINKILLDDAIRKTVKVYIMNPEDPCTMRERLQEHDFDLWRLNLAGFFPYSLGDLFPRSRGSETPVWRDILENYFEVPRV